VRAASGWLCVLAAAALLGRGEASPTIPQERIPPETPPDVRRPLEQLYSRDPVTRGYGAFALGRMGDRADVAVPFLLAMLDDDARLEWETRDADPTNAKEEARKRILGFYKDKETSPGREAARALARLCSKAPEGLLAALKSPSATVRRHVAEALGGIRDKEATVPLTELLRDEAKDVRARAAHALGRLRDTAATEALMAALKDPERSVRKEVVLALGEIKDPRALESLLDALLDTVEVRAAAEEVLLETRDLRAVEPLIVSLKHRKEEVRRISARLLGAIGDRRAFRPLIQALKDTATDVRFEASTALRRMSGEDFGMDPDKWQRWHDLDQAAGEVEERLTGDALHSYIGVLQSSGWAARAYAAKALGNLGDRRAVTALRGALWDKDPSVRAQAALALGALGDPQAVEALIAAITDADPEVQEAAEDALRRITGANFARDTRRWQEWWDENREMVFARDGGRPPGQRDPEDVARRAVEDAPATAPSRSRSFVLFLVLVLAAAFPLVALVVLRVLRPH